MKDEDEIGTSPKISYIFFFFFFSHDVLEPHFPFLEPRSVILS